MNERSLGPPRQILVVRHAEKPALLGPPSGVDENGAARAHSLIVKGWQRAGALASFFAEPRDLALQRPTAVYAPPTDSAHGDHGRPYETVTPTAAKLGVTINTRYALDQESELVPALLQAGGVILVAWEHNRIPRIANAILGDDTTAPQSWPDSRFDVVWIFDRDGEAGYRFTQRPQLLLSGDCEQCIDN